MTQDTVINGLRAALSKGTGDIDDLLNLLKHATADAEQIKTELAEVKAQEEAKRGAAIAELATRALHKETSAADVALIFNIYLEQQGSEIRLSEKDIEEGPKAAETLANSLISGIDALLNAIKDAEPKEKKKDTPDDVITRFLKTL